MCECHIDTYNMNKNGCSICHEELTYFPNDSIYIQPISVESRTIYDMTRPTDPEWELQNLPVTSVVQTW